MHFIPRQCQIVVTSVVLSFGSLPVFADALTQAIKTERATQSAAIKSQKKIDGLDERTRKMLEQYRSAARQTKTLLTYNAHLKELLASQEAEKASLEQQLQQIEVTQREIVPLILNMQSSLEQFVQLDLPFLPEERQQRIAKLQAMMNRADVTNAEKFRRIIEAYQIENDYGNTIEAYRANITLEGTTSSVDFLRIGRVALYYQRLDGSETGYWNQADKRWQTLPNEYQQPIRNGLRIARKETAPDLLILPVAAAVEAK
jgi:septal ring factor EnvC (AmiA/AmiB activator)